MKHKFIIFDFFMQKLIPFDVVHPTPMDALQSGLLLGLFCGRFWIPSNCPTIWALAFLILGLVLLSKQFACTLTAFKLEHLHATSKRGSIFSMGLAMNSTARVEQALLELQQKGGLVEDGADISHNVQEVD